MLQWDFRYVVESEKRRRDGKVSQTQLTSTVHGDDRYWKRRQRPVRINPWLCVAIIALCLWGLWELVK